MGDGPPELAGGPVGRRGWRWACWSLARLGWASRAAGGEAAQARARSWRWQDEAGAPWIEAEALGRACFRAERVGRRRGLKQEFGGEEEMEAQGTEGRGSRRRMAASGDGTTADLAQEVHTGARQGQHGDRSEELARR